MRNLNGGILVSKYFLSGFIVTIALNIFFDSKYSSRLHNSLETDSLLLQSELQKLTTESSLDSNITSFRKSSESHRPSKLSEEITFSGSGLSSHPCCFREVIENPNFILLRSDYKQALNLNSHVFRPQSESDYTDFQSLQAWYKELNNKRPLIQRPRYETSSLPWIYFNQSHLLSAETDVVTPKPIGNALRTHIYSLLDMAGQKTTSAIKRGWYQFIPKWGINLVLLLKEGDTLIRGFKEKAEDPVMIPMPFVTESQTIHWISPLLPRDKWKIPSLSNIKTNTKHNIHRHIIYDFDGIEANNKRFTTYQMKNLSDLSMLEIISRIIPNITHHPTYDTEALIFYSCVPQTNPTRNFLNRIRLNVLEGRQIFNPIPHVKYKIASSTSGFFDSENWDFVGFYAKDFPSVIRSLLTQRNDFLHILRVPEPDLSLPNGIPGITDGIQHIGERSTLEKYILNYIHKHPEESINI
ncbi:unnamed protein product [Lepeophtheirus salmonis]|uniref:Hexosyltransferase n=1 Tax=Lepeophtheirus salmonis TaxID=72036 RepID=A0A7R8CDX7_LEPSM|nr:unnamed protein product [Lepeophtheirus salmonis]CAF2790283.1 unnamed protein product [Lepeophtheirus salmonis]